jgi:hypothetical protein
VDIPWVQLLSNKILHGSREVGSFWWKDVFRLHVIYKRITSCVIGDGSIVVFWEDIWCGALGNLSPLYVTFPHLFSFCMDTTVSVKRCLDA